jgi:hypothetical protein
MRRFNWLYLAASLPFVLVATWGAEYGATWIYLVPALVTVVQFFFPTRLGWGLVTALYGGAVALYTGLAVADLWRLAIGEPLDLFLDADDSVWFLVMLAFLYVLLVGLVVSSPWSKKRHPRNGPAT